MKFFTSAWIIFVFDLPFKAIAWKVTLVEIVADLDIAHDEEEEEKKQNEAQKKRERNTKQRQIAFVVQTNHSAAQISFNPFLFYSIPVE